MYSDPLAELGDHEAAEPIAVRLADQSYAALDTQRVGRMGELVVELELLKRGWIVGNFNSSTMNSAGWDLFATRGTRSVKIRVKAKRPGVDCFRWSAKADGSILIGLADTDDDFVAAVSFDGSGGYEVFVMPSMVVEHTLARRERAMDCRHQAGRRTPQADLDATYLHERA